MNIIFQSYPAIDLKTNLWQMMKCDPVGIYLQGGTSDLLVEENKTDLLLKNLDTIRNAGVKVGYATHMPEALLRANYSRCVRIPMLPRLRSLNLANSVAIVLYETLRQGGFAGMERRGALNACKFPENG